MICVCRDAFKDWVSCKQTPQTQLVCLWQHRISEHGAECTDVNSRARGRVGLFGRTYGLNLQ